MISWEKRPDEIQALLNPAFIGRLIREFVQSYTKENKKDVPFELLFIFLPIALQKKFRDALPNTTRTQIHVWLLNHPEYRIAFANKNKNLVPFVREAITFLLQRDIISLTDQGEFAMGNKKYRRVKVFETEDVQECLKAAKFMGKWLARSGSSSTIYAIWGLRP
ncbi:DUF6521 family protein [Schinkia azotoformans]|uniref:three component ABC system middle component n=1 Tax=Schinkia azotoformans TaxID=1454 RepID=UPI002E22EB75|nr:DUF6521 family protein [Schinkia azotoformans]